LIYLEHNSILGLSKIRVIAYEEDSPYPSPLSSSGFIGPCVARSSIETAKRSM